MSDFDEESFGDWVNELAGEYVESWVGPMVAKSVSEKLSNQQQAIDALSMEWAKQQARIGALTAEVEEQARLLGASGSREVELLARVEALEVALTTIRYCEPFLGTGDCLTASEIAAEALRQETALSIYPLATVVNNNMPGTQHIIELPPNVTLDVGCKYRLVFVEEPTK